MCPSQSGETGNPPLASESACVIPPTEECSAPHRTTAVFGLKHHAEHNSPNYNRGNYPKSDPVKVLLDKHLDASSKSPYQKRDQQVAAATSNNNGEDKEEEVDIENARRNGYQLEGYGHKPCTKLGNGDRRVGCALHKAVKREIPR